MNLDDFLKGILKFPLITIIFLDNLFWTPQSAISAIFMENCFYVLTNLIRKLLKFIEFLFKMKSMINLVFYLFLFLLNLKLKKLDRTIIDLNFIFEELFLFLPLSFHLNQEFFFHNQLILTVLHLLFIFTL